MANTNGTSNVPQSSASKPLDLLSVKEVLNLGKNYSFFVPAYQRGYRWRPKEVELFIDDLVQFRTEEDRKNADDRCPFCCLQAVIVKERGKGVNQLEVIDGQQRLTTVLILLQALYTISEENSLQTKIELEIQGSSIKLSTPIICPDAYSIEYEHRDNSAKWLEDITKAFFHDKINGNTQKIVGLKNRNSDYYHLIDAYSTAICVFRSWDKHKRVKFEETLKDFTRFIWYNITNSGSNDTEVDIFDRINATKIALNNAELIKALLLQKDNFGSDLQLRDQLAIDWDNIEKRLQEPSFWGFIYSTRHPFEYESHIEYIFDLIKGKTKKANEDYYYTFNKYYDGFLSVEAKDRLRYVKECWNKVLEMILHLEEWYSDRTCYHYIGYLLEYGKEADSEEIISIPYLIRLLTDIPKDQRTSKLKDMVSDTLMNLKAKDLFHGDHGNRVTQLLFLLNIQSEQNRKNETARFSFSSYKQIQKQPGWNEEHVASNVDYSPKFAERERLAYEILEYFTGVEKGEEEFEEYKKLVEDHYPTDEEEKGLCEKQWKLFTLKDEDKDIKELNEIYGDIIEYFDVNKDDAFKENVQVEGTKSSKREKDFIWNFALLNATTNKSYGNNIYPLKRKRIMSDESYIYTPICTRALFEKAYSHKLSNLMVWSRKDAKDYWDYICDCLRDFLPANFNLPFTY